MSAARKVDGQVMALPLSVEERRERVERVRGLDERLAMIEKQLVHAQTILPAMVAEVRSIRRTIEENTAVPASEGPPAD